MKKLLFHIVLPALVLTATFSCNKYLDLKPQDGIIRQNYWKTKEEVQSAVIGCYASLLGDPSGADRPLSDYLFVWGETRADMVAPGLGITPGELDIMNVNTLSTNAFVKWSAVYRTINYCNTVIDFAPGVLSSDNTFTQAQLNSYLAEAKALRALMYFYLVRSFRDVPLKLKSTSSDNDLSQLPKTSSDTILAQIVSDLGYADSNAVVTYGGLTDKGRITKYTVKAIEADVFLWMERYADCEAACNYIINSGKFGLIAGDDGWFNTLYYKGNSNESIFEFQYDAQKLNSFYLMFGSTKPRYIAAATVMDDVFTIDYNDDRDVDIRGAGASVHTSDNAIWKYLGVTYSQARSVDASYAHWFVYRYADILLMKAEAINQIGGRGVEALNLIYTIRNRGHALLQTMPTPPDPTDQDGVADFILDERAREFAFEGKRWYDLLRNAKRNNYARLDILLTVISKSVAPNLQTSATNKYHDYNSHYFPISLTEIQADPNLIQNPFYK